MKYLVLLLVIVLVLWLAGRPRVAAPRGDRSARKPPPDAAPRPMVACAHCGVHLPRDEALPGSGGQHYCCEAHRASQR